MAKPNRGLAGLLIGLLLLIGYAVKVQKAVDELGEDTTDTEVSSVTVPTAGTNPVSTTGAATPAPLSPQALAKARAAERKRAYEAFRATQPTPRNEDEEMALRGAFAIKELEDKRIASQEAADRLWLAQNRARDSAYRNGTPAAAVAPSADTPVPAAAPAAEPPLSDNPFSGFRLDVGAAPPMAVATSGGTTSEAVSPPGFPPISATAFPADAPTTPAPTAAAGLAMPKAERRAQAKAGDEVRIPLPNGATLTFCYCPPGTFMMGSPKNEEGRQPHEGPIRVTVSKGFWMAQTEVTQRQWAAMKIPSVFPTPTEEADHPETGVSWEKAQGFISRLNQTVTLPAGFIAALPTEAQWEYGCRAGTQTPFSSGEALPSGAGEVVAVKSYSPNAWGLHDMHGNVQEWCEDGWDGKKDLTGGIDPTGDVKLGTHVLRGGSYLDSHAERRSAYRLSDEVKAGYGDVGFRIVLVPYHEPALNATIKREFQRFPLITPQLDAEGNAVFTETPGNVNPLIFEGQRYDGLRFRVERDREDAIFLWAFKQPPNLKFWGISPARGLMRGFTHWHNVKNGYVIQGLNAENLVTGQEYVLLFQWKDDAPVTLRTEHRFTYLPHGPGGIFDAKQLVKGLVRTNKGLEAFK